ncbi:hypothetical protein BDW75DRAFT_59933 [Aspergillus navahoensis]
MTYCEDSHSCDNSIAEGKAAGSLDANLILGMDSLREQSPKDVSHGCSRQSVRTINRLLQSNQSTEINNESPRQLPYPKAVIIETLRLKPTISSSQPRQTSLEGPDRRSMGTRRYRHRRFPVRDVARPNTSPQEMNSYPSVG